MATARLLPVYRDAAAYAQAKRLAASIEQRTGGRRSKKSRKGADVDRDAPRTFPLGGGFRLAVRPFPFGAGGRELEWRLLSAEGAIVDSGEAFDFEDARREALRTLAERRAYESGFTAKGRSGVTMRQLTSGRRDPKRLTTRERNRLPDEAFALPERRALPVHDAAHVRNAAARLEQMRTRFKSVTPAEYRRAKRAILEREADLGIGPFRERDVERDPPMKRRELLSRLNECGARFVREGGEHTLYESTTGEPLPVPRHTQISAGVTRRLLKTGCGSARRDAAENPWSFAQTQVARAHKLQTPSAYAEAADAFTIAADWLRERGDDESARQADRWAAAQLATARSLTAPGRWYQQPEWQSPSRRKRGASKRSTRDLGTFDELPPESGRFPSCSAARSLEPVHGRLVVKRTSSKRTVTKRRKVVDCGCSHNDRDPDRTDVESSSASRLIYVMHRLRDRGYTLPDAVSRVVDLYPDLVVAAMEELGPERPREPELAAVQAWHEYGPRRRSSRPPRATRDPIESQYLKALMAGKEVYWDVDEGDPDALQRELARHGYNLMAGERGWIAVPRKRRGTAKRDSRAPQRVTRAQREFISEKIRTLRHEGYPQDQAIAIAYRMAGVPPRPGSGRSKRRS